jgi:hypothetical protein
VEITLLSAVLIFVYLLTVEGWSIELTPDPYVCCMRRTMPRNEASILLCEGSVCAPGHKARQSTKEAPNFREYLFHALR